MRTLAIRGQRCCTFLRAFSRFSVLNALAASRNRTACTSRDSKTWFIACTAASHLASCPAQSWTVPATAWMSSSTMEMIALLIFLQDTSPIPMGLTYGHLSKAIRRHAMSGCRAMESTYDEQIHRATRAKASQRSAEPDFKEQQRTL